MSDSLWPHKSQQARPPCPSPTPRVHPNSCALSCWCRPAISSSVIPFSCPQIPPSIRVFSNESTPCMRWPKYWSFSFSISPSNEHPGLVSFRMDWLDLLAVQGTRGSLLQQMVISHVTYCLLFLVLLIFLTAKTMFSCDLPVHLSKAVFSLIFSYLCSINKRKIT